MSRESTVPSSERLSTTSSREAGISDISPNPESRSGPSEGSPRAIAFFDLDGTLVDGQTQYLLVRFLRGEGALGWAFLIGTILWFVAYKAKLVRVTEQARAKSARMFTGMGVESLQQLMDQFNRDVMLPRLHPEAAAALRSHQSRQDLVIVISAAIEPLVRALSLSLGLNEWIATRCEVRSGRYTGSLEGNMPHGVEKARRAQVVMDRTGVEPAACWAYADHETDLPLLRLVGHPVAVRPRPGLANVAHEEGWPVLA
jgi:HAD superfamily hydrolase (TIGR01490 family)